MGSADDAKIAELAGRLAEMNHNLRDALDAQPILTPRS